MAYTAPVYTASGQTWATLKTLGFSGYAQGLLAGLGVAATATANQNLGSLLQPNQADKVIERCRNIVDSYTTGQADKTSVKLAIFDCQEALGVLAAALGEIGVLIDAN
jgi:hypothetical protein